MTTVKIVKNVQTCQVFAARDVSIQPQTSRDVFNACLSPSKDVNPDLLSQVSDECDVILVNEMWNSFIFCALTQQWRGLCLKLNIVPVISDSPDLKDRIEME